jgi:hypothetical protein
MGLEADGCSPDVLNPVCEYESPNVKKNVVSDARLMGVAAPVEMALAASQSSRDFIFMTVLDKDQ